MKIDPNAPAYPEEWRSVFNDTSIDYECSTLGQVRRIRSLVNHSKKGLKIVHERILKPNLQKTGYLTLSIRIGGKTITGLVHRLIAKTFLENPDNKPQVNHKNGIKSDNRLENLEWCTRSENQSHRYDTLGQDTPNRKLSKDQVFDILSRPYEKRKSLAIKHKVTVDCVEKVRAGINYKKYHKEFAELNKAE